MGKLGIFIARNFTWLWCRYWQSRIAATIYCADKWLGPERPEFKWQHLAARSIITLLLFLAFGSRSVSVRLRFEE